MEEIPKDIWFNSHFTPRDIWSLRLVNKEYNRLFGPLLFPLFKREYERFLGEKGIPLEMNTIAHPQGWFTGGSVLRALLGGTWGGSDVDIFLPGGTFGDTLFVEVRDRVREVLKIDQSRINRYPGTVFVIEGTSPEGGEVDICGVGCEDDGGDGFPLVEIYDLEICQARFNGKTLRIPKPWRTMRGECEIKTPTSKLESSCASLDPQQRYLTQKEVGRRYKYMERGIKMMWGNIQEILI